MRISPICAAAGSAGSTVMSPLTCWVTPTTVRVEVGAPIPTAGLTLDDRDRLAQAVRDRMQAMLRMD
jgi:hypothetical protein